MRHILLVEDDDSLRTAIREFLESKGNRVTEVSNGRIGRDLARAEAFDLVICDVRMPYFNGVELLQWMKKEKPTPFILISGFSNALGEDKATQLGADGFLSKPFKNTDLISKMEEVIQKYHSPQTPLQIEENFDSQFCKVSIEEFVTKPVIEFDVYVRLTASKYLKIAHKGETLLLDRISSYKSKGVQVLHIRREDFGQLVDFNLRISKLIQNNVRIPREKKIAFLRYTSETLMEQCFVNGLDLQGFKDAGEHFTTAVSVLADSDNIFESLDMLSSHSNPIYAHSVAVGIYSVMLARKMGHTSAQTFFKLSMAGLFHDIGMKEIDKDLLEKPQEQLTLQERKVLESHVARGKEILESIEEIPADIIQIVFEHHEDVLGEGFPQGKKAAYLHPLSKILQMTNAFAEAVVSEPNGPRKTAAEAVAILENSASKFDRLVFNALKNIISGH